MSATATAARRSTRRQSIRNRWGPVSRAVGTAIEEINGEWLPFRLHLGLLDTLGESDGDWFADILRKTCHAPTPVKWFFVAAEEFRRVTEVIQ